jgi:hypothetical protein
MKRAANYASHIAPNRQLLTRGNDGQCAVVQSSHRPAKKTATKGVARNMVTNKVIWLNRGCQMEKGIKTLCLSPRTAAAAVRGAGN